MKRLVSFVGKSALRSYGLGLLCVVVGAGATNMAESMWPLALGSSVAVMCTVALVRDIRGRAAARRAAGERRPPRP
jgi:hypothetical protein